MKKIIFISILILIQTLNLKSEDFRLNQLISGLNSPWSLTFKNENEILITEKLGQILLINLKNNTIKKIKHNLNVLEDGQGGLLEILYYNETVFVSYSENRLNGMSSTSVARSKFDNKKLNNDISYYLHRPSATDKSMAPEGHDCFYVLVPVPNNQSNINWNIEGEKMKNLVIDKMQNDLMPDLKNNIVEDFYLTPDYFERDLNTKSGFMFCYFKVFII